MRFLLSSMFIVIFAYSQKKNQIITDKTILKTLNFLTSDEVKGRKPSTPEMEKVVVFLENIFKEQKVKPYFKTYRDVLSSDRSMYNLVGVINGVDKNLAKEFVMIGAHYDHIGIKSESNLNDSVFNGANDNASGCGAVVEMIRYFSKNKPKRSIIFAFFTGEEIGLKGSWDLAEKLKAQNLNLYFMYNFEMIGVPMQQVDHKFYLTGYNVSNMATIFNEKAGYKLAGNLPEELKFQLFRRSDNFPFYKEFNIPSQTVSTFDFKNYDYYHDLDDEIDKLNINHMVEVINVISPVLEKIINEPEKIIKLNAK